MEEPLTIPWREWGDDAFRAAQKEDKLILLSISALWCHWCHVMDNTTYSHPLVINEIENNFIPIRVNTDLRPDINERYNMGGWPTTVFLTPTGEFITGGTYIPPDTMLKLLRTLVKSYRENRESFYLMLSNKTQTKEILIPEDSSHKPVMNDVEDAIVINYDRTFGGFGREPKFPQIEVLLYSLRQGFIHDDRELLDIVDHTLQRMAESDIYDKVAGGFFRYATKQDWSEPHYEKMLEDNAGLLRLYTEAYQVFNNGLFKRIAEEINYYLTSTLYDSEKNYFYGSQDADEKYYSLSGEERKKVLPPSFDRNLYTNWNADAADALIYAGSALGINDMTDIAYKVLETIKERCIIDGVILHCPENREVQMLLTDIVSTARALLDAYFYSGNKNYINFLSSIINKAMEILYDKEQGGFYDKPEFRDDFGDLKSPLKPFLLNARMAEVLAFYSILTEDERWRRTSEEILDLYAGLYRNYSIFAAGYASAFYFTKSPSLTLNVILKNGIEGAEELKNASFTFYYPGKSIIFYDAEKDYEILKRKGFDSGIAPAVYPCEGSRCFTPIREPGGFKKLLEELKG